MIAENHITAVSTERNVTVDMLKAIAIVGVLTIHSATGGYRYAIGSFDWCSSVFWGCLTRASVPIFFMCSGALLLDPKKQLDVQTLYRKNLLRVVIALLFWAMAYKIYGLLWLDGGVTAQNIIQSIKEVLLFQHEFHLYYLHIIILVYVFLPITRILTANATKSQLRYVLAVWFVLGIVYPTARAFWPFTLLSGIPLQWSINMAYAAIGYGILGYYIKKYSVWKTSIYLLIFLFGFACVFGGTLAMSIWKGMLYQLFLEGMSPGVAIMAIGLFGMMTALYQNKARCQIAEKLSKASFCIYLVHMFFLYLLTGFGLTVEILPCLFSIPILVFSVLVCSYLTYLILSHIPVVNQYLI